MDKKQIIYFKLICYNWSKLYKELLNDFGIEAELVPDFGHQYVKYTINKEIYLNKPVYICMDDKLMPYVSNGKTYQTDNYSSTELTLLGKAYFGYLNDPNNFRVLD